MNENHEFEGKTLEEAIGAAASRLGIAETDLHYEVLEQGRRGLLGMGTKNVRIRIMPPLDGDWEPELAESGADIAPVVDSAAVSAVEQTLQRIVDLMGFRLTVRSSASPQGSVTLRLEGADEKLLKQRGGELLLALQFLLNRMARRSWPDLARVHVTTDSDGGRRDEQLVELAREAAQQVSQTGRTRKLRPMNAYERRLVHLTVREFTGLTSSSDGDGAMKSVRISKVQNSLEGIRTG